MSDCNFAKIMKKWPRRKFFYHFFFFFYHLNFPTLKIIISGKMWTLCAYSEPNDTKALKNNTYTCAHSAHCNFKHFKFANTKSTDCYTKIDFAMQIYFSIAVLRCKIFERNRSLVSNPCPHQP